MEEVVRKDDKVLRCLICGSMNIYTTSTYRVCRKCGERTLLAEVEEEANG